MVAQPSAMCFVLFDLLLGPSHLWGMGQEGGGGAGGSFVGACHSVSAL